MDRDVSIAAGAGLVFLATEALRQRGPAVKVTPLQVKAVSSAGLSALRGAAMPDCGGSFDADIYPQAITAAGTAHFTNICGREWHALRDGLERSRAGQFMERVPTQTTVVCGRMWAQRWINAWKKMADAEPVLMAAATGLPSAEDQIEHISWWEKFLAGSSLIVGGGTEKITADMLGGKVAADVAEEANELMYVGSAGTLPPASMHTGIGRALVRIREVLDANSAAAAAGTELAEPPWVTLIAAVVQLAGELDGRVIHGPDRWKAAWSDFVDTVTDPGSYAGAAGDAAAAVGGAAGNLVASIVFSNLGGLVAIVGGGVLLWRATR